MPKGVIYVLGNPHGLVVCDPTLVRSATYHENRLILGDIPVIECTRPTLDAAVSPIKYPRDHGKIPRPPPVVHSEPQHERASIVSAATLDRANVRDGIQSVTERNALRVHILGVLHVFTSCRALSMTVMIALSSSVSASENERENTAFGWALL